MKLYIAQALVTDAQLQWIDDNDPVVLDSFLGAHDSPEKAMSFLNSVANADRDVENELIDECETGEAHMPPLELSFRKETRELEGVARDRWTSDTVEFANRGMTVQYQVFESSLNPVL